MKTIKKIITVFMTFCLSFTLFTYQTHADSPFSDVSEKTSGYDAILWAYNGGMINGFSDGTFRPTDKITRAQTAVMIWKYNGSPDITGTCPFKDIGSFSANVKKAITWCYEHGIVKGTDSTHFNPNGNLTREQMAIILHRMGDEPGTIGIPVPFKDISSCSSSVKKAIAFLYINEITKGTSKTTYGPKENCTRAQFCIFMYRFHNRPFKYYTDVKERVFSVRIPASYFWNYTQVSDTGYDDYEYWFNIELKNYAGETLLLMPVVSGTYGIDGTYLNGTTHVRITNDGKTTDYYYHYDGSHFEGIYFYRDSDLPFSGRFVSDYMSPGEFFLIMNTWRWIRPKA